MMINNITDIKKNKTLSLKKHKFQNPSLIDIFECINEHDFIEDYEVDFLYSKRHIISNDKIKIPSPLLGLKIIDYANIKKDSLTLIVDSSTGYLPVFCSHLAATVVATDKNDKNLKLSDKIINKLEINNIIIEDNESFTSFAPFTNIILINPTTKAPKKLIKLISDSGKLTYMKKDNNLIQIINIDKEEKEVISEEMLSF